MRLKTILYILLFLGILLTYFIFRKMHTEYNSITTYEACKEAGYPILESYPEQCKMPGKTFINDTQKAEEDIIVSTSTRVKNYKNGTYTIEGIPLTLKNGQTTYRLIEDSSSTETVKYFGNEVRGDFDGNGTEDIAFLITKSSSGSGTFFYITTALLGDDGLYDGTNALLLGDRIAPQTTSLTNSRIVVNYADRKPTEPMTAQPSVGVSRYFRILNDKLIEEVR